MRYLFGHLYFICLFVFLYFVEPAFLDSLMIKGILFVPNMILIFLQTIIPSKKSKQVNLKGNKSSYNESETINLLELATKNETIELIERPGTKVAIGLTKPRKPRKIELGMQNKNALV